MQRIMAQGVQALLRRRRDTRPRGQSRPDNDEGGITDLKDTKRKEGDDASIMVQGVYA